jgi:hypothetical protein
MKVLENYTFQESKPRVRRTRDHLAQLDQQIIDALVECSPQSVRHVFYLMTNPRLPKPVEKTERGYKHVMKRLIALRESGRVEYDQIVDASRTGYHVATYEDPIAYMYKTASDYRSDVWLQTPYYVEVWCESRSIAGVILQTCQKFGVSLYPAGGYTSISFAYEAAESINWYYKGREVRVFYVGDYDPAGIDIDRDIKQKLRRHLKPEVSLTFIRVAITKEQIERYDLPTKPRKKGDRRSPEVEETVEAEAMSPSLLRDLLRNEIEALLPPHALAAARAEDERGRQLIEQLAEGLARKGW